MHGKHDRQGLQAAGSNALYKVDPVRFPFKGNIENDDIRLSLRYLYYRHIRIVGFAAYFKILLSFKNT